MQEVSGSIPLGSTNSPRGESCDIGSAHVRAALGPGDTIVISDALRSFGIEILCDDIERTIGRDLVAPGVELGQRGLVVAEQIFIDEAFQRRLRRDTMLTALYPALSSSRTFRI